MIDPERPNQDYRPAYDHIAPIYRLDVIAEDTETLIDESEFDVARSRHDEFNEVTFMYSLDHVKVAVSFRQRRRQFVQKVLDVSSTCARSLLEAGGTYPNVYLPPSIRRSDKS